MNKEKKIIISLVLLFHTGCFCLYAQQTDTIRKELPEVSIVATRTEKNVMETGRSITVLTKQDLENSVYTTVAELISAQAGIYIVGTGQTPGSNESIFMRGCNSNQTAVYVDGIRITDVSTVNNTADLSELPLNSIDRIEIIRGSHSTLYGSSAIGGVIQIFTDKKFRNGLHTGVQLSSGTFGSKTFELNPSIQSSYCWSNGIGVFVDADVEKVSGLNATVDTITNPLIYNHPDRDGWLKKQFGGGVNFHGKNTDGSIAYHNLSMQTDIDLGAFHDDDNNKLDFTRHMFSGNLNFKLSQIWELAFNAGFSSTIRNSVNDSSVIDTAGNFDHNYFHDQYSGQTVNGELLFKYHGKNWHGIAGTSARNEKMNSVNNFYSPYYSSNTNLDSINPHAGSWDGIFLQADISGNIIAQSLKSFNLVVGARILEQMFINRSWFGDGPVLQLNSIEINPSVKFSDNALFYFSYSTGYNAPSLYELFAPDIYHPYDFSPTTEIPLGNKELKKETSSSFEIGLKQKIDRNGFIGISIFQTKTKNQIDYVYLWDKNIPIDSLGTNPFRDDHRGERYINTGTQTVYGIEITMENHITSNLKFNAHANLLNGYLDYDLSSATVDQTGGNYIQVYNNGIFLTKNKRYEGLVRRPNSALAGLTYSAGDNFSIALCAKYTGSRSDLYYDSTIQPWGALATTAVNDYTTVDINGKCKLNNHLSCSYRVENIFDKKYFEIRGFNTRGRGFYIKLMYSI